MSGSVVKITRNDFAVSGGELGIKQGIIGAATRIRGQAVALCPVDFGQLRNSIMWITAEEDGGFNSQPGEKAPASHKLTPPTQQNVALVGTGSDHWYPEFGTRFQIAQPFLRPAMELTVKSGEAAEIAVKYGREAMEEEFRKRKTRVANA